MCNILSICDLSKLVCNAYMNVKSLVPKKVIKRTLLLVLSCICLHAHNQIVRLCINNKTSYFIARIAWQKIIYIIFLTHVVINWNKFYIFIVFKGPISTFLYFFSFNSTTLPSTIRQIFSSFYLLTCDIVFILF